jgi:chromate transporter
LCLARQRGWRNPFRKTRLVGRIQGGGVLFGGGYVLLAFLRADLVERRHWLSEAQVFTTATFSGYLLGGRAGAGVAFLDGVNAASLALRVVVTWYLGRAAFVDLTIIIVGSSAAALLI